METKPYQGCTYVCPIMMRDLPTDYSVVGWVEIGGDPNKPQTRWAATAKAHKRKGIFGGYDLYEDRNYPSQDTPTGRRFTKRGARKEITNRIQSLAQTLSKELNIPIVDHDEARRHQDIANEKAMEIMRYNNNFDS